MLATVGQVAEQRWAPRRLRSKRDEVSGTDRLAAQAAPAVPTFSAKVVSFHANDESGADWLGPDGHEIGLRPAPLPQRKQSGLRRLVLALVESPCCSSFGRRFTRTEEAAVGRLRGQFLPETSHPETREEHRGGTWTSDDGLCLAADKLCGARGSAIDTAAGPLIVLSLKLPPLGRLLDVRIGVWPQAGGC